MMTELFSYENITALALMCAQILAIVFPLLIGVAYLVWAERRIIGAMQLRKGPYHVGWQGLLQPFADLIKLIFKENVIPAASHKVVYLLAPMMVLIPAVMAWAVVPFDKGIVMADVNLGVMYLLAVSSLGIYGVLMAGWASNSKYPFLGAVRTGAQMISYEVSLGLTVLSVILLSGSMNLTDIVEHQKGLWHVILLFPMFIVFLISMLAETNRAPFDLPEAEAELVAGYFLEYSSSSFALFFVAEYANMILMSIFASILFLGGWLPPVDSAPFTWIPGFIWLFIKVAFILFIFLWARATFPRFRYDQLMRLGWKVLLPFTLLWFVVQASIMQVLK